MEITVRYRAVDGYRETRRYKTVAGARRRVVHYLGEHPEISKHGAYAVADDGVGICRVDGIALEELLSDDR